MESPLSKNATETLLRLLYKGIYILAIGFILFKAYQYNHPNFGYGALANFGQQFHEQSLNKLKETHHYTHPNASGYDGQLYVQLALEPSATGLEIEKAMDNYNYRARRILFSWTAYALGLGQPNWIIQAYGIQNFIFWIFTALLLLKWLPPNSWQNVIRFVGSLFTAGIVYSLNLALLDGPSLSLIILAAYFIETNKGWLGSAILGLAGLAKETNLLAATALWKPANGERKSDRPRLALQCALVALPFILWYAYILNSSSVGLAGVAGKKNFDLPLVGFFSTCVAALKEGGETGFPKRIYFQFAMLASLLAQAVYFLAKPKTNQVWWRIGASYATLMIFLGDAVWAGVEAAPRVLLPMTIGFNILFSRKRALLPILLFVNVLAVVGIFSLQPPHIPMRFDLKGQSNYAYDAATYEYSSMEFGEGWYVNEGNRNRYWKWSSGTGGIFFRIPGDQPIKAHLSITPKTLGTRDIILEVNGEESWSMRAENGYSERQIIPITLVPGENALIFHSPQPAMKIGEDPRDLSFALYNYTIELLYPITE